VTGRLRLEPSLDPADYHFSHPVRTRFAETDAMGVVHHGSYLLYLEEARVALMRHRDRPYDDTRAAGVELPVLEAYVRYRRPVRFDEVVDVHVTMGAVTRATFQMAYLLTVEDEARATAVTVHGAVDSDGRAVRLPGWISGRAPRG
jgi:acyl-CoA thioester hydrolase